MQAEILPVSLADKQTAIDYTRAALIPHLVESDFDSERVLRILHRVGTWRASLGTAESNMRIDGYIAFFGGADGVPTTLLDLETKLAELSTDSSRYSPYGYFIRGNYRILGCFAPNPLMAPYAPETAEHFVAAIPVNTQDYHNRVSPVYYPPVFNIHKLLNTVTTTFDNRIELVQTPEQLAKLVADFYFWGLVMLHPFLGGNHRAYDRFMEYAFAKKGLHLEAPLNETLNIPNNDPFNRTIFTERHRLLQQANLVAPDLNDPQKKAKWLTYQHQLGEMIIDAINSDCAKTEQAAKAILAWL